MSFLSRRTSRSDQRGTGRQADSDYGDYNYAPGEYQQDDDWSPDEYFSPEGIKGRWAAGSRPGGRAGDRGRRDEEHGYGAGPQRGQAPRGQAGRYGRDAYQRDAYGQDAHGKDAHGQDDGYRTGEYATGGYEADSPSDGEPGGGRRRRTERSDRGDRTDGADRSDRGERRRLLGRRDRGDDIWPDDGVSDEDYWASVAADRPLASTSSALDADPMKAAGSRPMARQAGAARAAGDSRLDGRPAATESRFGSESRTGSGRLGPAPGTAGYPPGAQGAGAPGTRAPGAGSRPLPGGSAGGANSGPIGRPGGANSGPIGRANSGPIGRAGGGPNSGPISRAPTGSSPAWPAAGSGPTGPTPTRSGAGPMPGRSGGPAHARSATGPTPTRSATGPHAARPAAGLAQQHMSPTMSGQAQPTVAQPALSPSFQPNTGRGASRPPERTERPERPERLDWADRTERIDRVGAAGYPDPRMSARPPAPAPSRAASTPSSVWGRDESAALSLPEPGRNTGTAGRHAVTRGADDDPLTSKRYSREELSKTDGRSYRVASRRARVTSEQYDAALTEQTQTFSMNDPYQADPQPGTGRYPAYGGQRPGQLPAQQPRQPASPYDRGTPSASYPYPGRPYPSRPAAAEHDEDRRGRPARPDPLRNAGYNPGAGSSAGGGYGGNTGYGGGGRY